ncbi:hypothetical protein [Pseudobythopirellula maris]|nr:hypothetical protein [Pseudobythopirellula maris]
MKNDPTPTAPRAALALLLLLAFVVAAPSTWAQETSGPAPTPPLDAAADEAPLQDPPAAQEPAPFEEPAVEEPLADDSAAQEPATQDPATQEPIAEEPATEQPAGEDTDAEEPEAEATSVATDDSATGETETDEAVINEEEADTDDDEQDEDEPDGPSFAERLPPFIAVLHPAAVHMPVALYVFGAMFVVIGWFAPSWGQQIPIASLHIGTLGAILAAASGWWIAEYSWGEEFILSDAEAWKSIDWDELITLHRWGGVVVAGLGVVVSFLSILAGATGSRRLAFVWKFGLLILAGLVGLVGHFGGELVHGEGFVEDALQMLLNP